MKTRADWDAYVARELNEVRPLLSELGFALTDKQPHLAGERFLQQAVTSVAGPKLILVGTRTSDAKRVIIKASSDQAGIREIEHERTCRAALDEINFAYHRFYAPEELMYVRRGRHVLTIQEFIEQTSAFLDRPIEEQFSLALTGLKIQEGAHATTYGHLRRISKVFPLWGAKEYLAAAVKLGVEHGAQSALTEGVETIELYSGFLTHSDFVPHNIRVRDDKLYLLDHSSIRFGNKHEGWARFVNFMVLHNPPLADALCAYLANNRTPEETESLRLMRIYRLTEILSYYRGTLERTEGNLQALNTARIAFWKEVLTSVLNRTTLPASVREEYIVLRDTLRSPDEKERQVGLH